MSDELTSPLSAAWPETWTPDDTEAFLSRQALPAAFRWPHREKNEDGSEMSDKEKRKAALDKARKYKEQTK
jgi:hypothetical protein